MSQLVGARTRYISCVLILCFNTICLITLFYLSNLRQSFQRPCVEKEVHLSNKSLPLIGLVSFPGSGNTWTRHLIQQMTGFGTSSVFCDVELKKGGFPFECTKHRNKTIVTKAHGPRFAKYSSFSKIVYLIRNPYDAFLAFTNWKKSGHTGHPTEEALIKKINRTFEEISKQYINITRTVVEQFKGPVYVLQYERLKTNTAEELGNLAEFLNANVTEHDIYCTVKQQEGNFHRKTTDEKHNQLLKRVYNKEKLLKIQETVRYTEKLFKESYDINIDLKGPEKHLFLT